METGFCLCFLCYLFARPVAGDVVHISRTISTMIDAVGAATVTTLMHRIESVIGWLGAVVYSVVAQLWGMNVGMRSFFCSCRTNQPQGGWNNFKIKYSSFIL